MRNRLAALLVLTAFPVLYRAAAGFLHRHFSPDWEFAQGHWFLHAYDAAYTYAPVLLLVLVAWSFRRGSLGLVAYGLALLVVVLIGPLIISLQKFPDHPVLAWWLADFSFLASSVPAIAAFAAVAFAIWGRREAAV